MSPRSTPDLRMEAVSRSLIVGINEAAKLYGVTSQTIHRWRREIAPHISDWRALRASLLEDLSEYGNIVDMATYKVREVPDGADHRPGS